MKLANDMELEIALNGGQLPLNQFATPQIQMDESDEFGIPILSLQLVDNTGGSVVKSITPIPDGALIGITISHGGASTTREFRVSASQNEGPYLLIRGYLNHPTYILETAKSIITATSSVALKQLADRCGLAFEGPITADSMRWQPSNQRMVNFARFILAGSYCADDSMMVGRITLDGSMKIRNLAAKQEPKALFSYSDGGIPIYGFKPSPMSLSNIHGGYKQVVAAPDMFGKTESLDSMELEVNEVSLNRNPKVADLNPNGSFKYLTIAHPRNVHPKYSRACYNNKRVGQLYSMRSALLINNAITNLSALDDITLSLHNNADGTDGGALAQAYDGTWVTSSKSIYVDNGQYFERFNLMRMGLGINMHANTI